MRQRPFKVTLQLSRHNPLISNCCRCYGSCSSSLCLGVLVATVATLATLVNRTLRALVQRCTAALHCSVSVSFSCFAGHCSILLDHVCVQEVMHARFTSVKVIAVIPSADIARRRTMREAASTHSAREILCDPVTRLASSQRLIHPVLFFSETCGNGAVT